MNTPSRSTVGIGSSTRQPRLARYSALVAATGASTLAQAAIVTSAPGVVATVNTSTAQQGYTSGPGGITWGQTRNDATFVVNGRSFVIEAFNLRTAAVPRLMGGAFGGTSNVGVAGNSGTPIFINRLAAPAVVGGGGTAFLNVSFYGGRPVLGLRVDKGVYTSNPPVGAAQPGVNAPLGGTRNSGNFISAGTAMPTGEIRGYVGFRLSNLSGGVSTMYGYFDVGYDWTTNTVTVYSWSYDDSGNPITINPSVVPGGAGLAALSIGAAGLRGRRRTGR